MADTSHAAPVTLARRRAITAGLLLGISLAALEATVVGTAMPTVVATLGGLAHYSWVFSAYLLTSTATVPIWGRLSDLYGRRRIYLGGVVVFLLGSMLSGISQTMFQLIAARAVQGLGAGAIVPLSVTIVGELYTLAERGRTQALFSGVWGIASIAGPLLGGYITDALSWRWVFYINLPFGVLSLAVIALSYPRRAETTRARVDWLGAALMFAGVSALLLAVGGETGAGAVWLVASGVLLALFTYVERRVVDPILPLALFRRPLIAYTSVVAFLFGAAMFGAVAFVPLYLQGVLGATATQAGQVLTPLFLGWVISSVLSARLTVRLGYRPMAIAGGVLLTAGFAGLALFTPDTSRFVMLGACFTLGLGMGASMLATLLAVQHGVERPMLGIATSLNQFSRSIGGSVGVSAMGALMTRALAGVPLPQGAVTSVSAIALTGMSRLQFAAALHQVFVAGAVIAVCALAVTLLLPPVSFSRGVPPGAGEQMIAAEMTTLDPDEEPAGVLD